jgi:hypothetical protein
LREEKKMSDELYSRAEEIIGLRIKLMEAEEKISSLMEVIVYGHELEYETICGHLEEGAWRWFKNSRYACRLILPIMGDKLLMYTEVLSAPWEDKILADHIKKNFVVSAVHHICKKVKMKKILLRKFERLT